MKTKDHVRTHGTEGRKRKVKDDENTSDEDDKAIGLDSVGSTSVRDEICIGDEASSFNEDHQEEFKILGQTNFNTLKKINVTTSWIANATLFPAELREENLSEFLSVAELPDPIVDMVRRKIKFLFPVQKAVLPVLLKEINHIPVLRPRDIAISAPTGSGKTLCYVLPILAQVGPKPSGILRALVVAPVQTLVLQIQQEFASSNGCGAAITALSGASDFSKEQRQLAPEGVCISDIIISTPGRLMDHITDPSSGINLSTLRFLVVDEADRMTTMVRQEWLEVVERRSGCGRSVCLADFVASRLAPRKILLSATLSKDIEELHMWNLHQPRFFCADASASKKEDVDIKSLDHVSGPLSLPSTIRHTVLVVDKKFHPLALYLKILENGWKKVLVFTNKKDSALRLKILVSYLAESVFTVENLTGDLFGHRRAKILKRFKNGKTRVLICSDVLSRGVDVEEIDCVVNYDLPRNDRLFVHRAGRSGRVGRPGHVLSLADGKARKFFVKNVLTKNGLWINAEELLLDEHVLEPHLVGYQNALNHLKSTLVAMKVVDLPDKKRVISGFAYRKKSRYHALKKLGRFDKKLRTKEKIVSDG